jgi:hypothetical protein
LILKIYQKYIKQRGLNMTVTTKPKAKARPDEATVQGLISKGGSVAAAGEGHGPREDEYTQVLVRLPVAMLAQIDTSAKSRKPVKIARNTWMIEAFYSRLQNAEK